MNLSQEKIIAEMGIGPVWKLRSNVIEQTDSVQALPAMDFSSGPINKSSVTAQNVSDSDQNFSANNSNCQTCGWCLGSLSGVYPVSETGPNYFFIHDCHVYRESDQVLGLPSADKQLLNGILRELGVKIGVNAYTAGIVNTKPIGSVARQFNKQESEVFLCLSCVKKQIELIRPTVIVSFGSVAAMSLLGLEANTTLGALRGQLHRYDETPLIVTQELSYLLQQPKEKRGLWADLCLAMSANS